MEFFIALILWMWIGFLKVDHDTNKKISDRQQEKEMSIIHKICLGYDEEKEFKDRFNNNQDKNIESVKDEIDYVFGKYTEYIWFLPGDHPLRMYGDPNPFEMIYQIYLAKEYGKTPPFCTTYKIYEMPINFRGCSKEERKEIAMRYCSVIERYIKEKHSDLDIYLCVTDSQDINKCFPGEIKWNFSIADNLKRCYKPMK